MHRCSIHKQIEIVAGDMKDYRQLAACHYRDNQPVAVQAVYTLRPRRALGLHRHGPAGVIVYAMPNPRVALRNIATGGIFAGLDRQTELALLNRNVRCIARVIIEPRFRGIGLATRLVRETMPKMNVPAVEALGIMPLVNPFLEKAGMKAFEPRLPVEHAELIESLSAVGIEENDLVDPERVQGVLDQLPSAASEFVEIGIQRFLKSHGTRRSMPGGIERTRYILGRLTPRPAYYIWFNPNLEVTMP